MFIATAHAQRSRSVRSETFSGAAKSDCAPALKRMSMHRQTNNVLPRDEQSMKPKDWPAVGLGRFGQFFDVDFQAEHLQAANEIFALQLDVLAIKVITAEFGVSLIAL